MGLFTLPTTSTPRSSTSTSLLQDGYCDVALTSSTFDLGTDDNLSFGNNVQTGQTFGDSGSLPCKFLYFTQEEVKKMVPYLA